MEYLLAVAHAKAGDFYPAQLFLVSAIVEFGYSPLPKNLNTLLGYAVRDLPSGRDFAVVLCQYMDFRFPPSHVPRPTLNAKTFALRTQLCSTAYELTELLGQADHYRLLTSHMLQEEFFKRGVHILEGDLSQHTHLMHGWLTRMHRPKTRYARDAHVPEYRAISPNVESKAVFAFCQAKCAASAINILASLLKYRATIPPARRTKLLKAVLATIIQHPQAHSIGWKSMAMDFVLLHLRPHGNWQVEPVLFPLVSQALACLNEPQLAESFESSLPSEYFSVDVSSCISKLKNAPLSS